MRQTSSRRFRRLSVAGLALSLVGFSWLLLAQDASPEQYMPYALRHARAADVSAHVRQVLAPLSVPNEVVVDAQNNRLLVRGSEQVQNVARQVVETLDKPAPQPQAQPATQQPVAAPIVKGYPLGDRSLEATANELRTKFPPSTGVRITPDNRTRQLIVVGPESAHRKVAALLAPIQRFAAQTQAGLQAKGYQLTNISWRELEEQISGIWQGQLTRSIDRGGELATFQLATPTGVQPLLQIDRRHNRVSFLAPPNISGLWQRVIVALDRPRDSIHRRTQLVTIDRADPNKIEQAVAMVRTVSQHTAPAPLPRAGAGAPPAGNQSPTQPSASPAGGNGMPPADGQVTGVLEEDGGLIGPVQIEFIEGLDVLVLRGNQRDVDRVRAIIADIERFSTETQPSIEIHHLQHVGSQVMADLVSAIYDEILSPRQGQVTITPLVKPNALLMIGRPDSVKIVLSLIDKLDQPVEREMEFEIFQLKFISALDAAETIQNFFVDRLGQAQAGTQTAQQLRPGLGARVNVIPDYRTNSLIIQASPRDLDEVRRMITQLDVETAASKKEVKVFRLKNALATEIAPVLQDALNWQLTGNKVPLGAQNTGGFGGRGFGGQTEETARLRSAILTFMTVDSEGHKILESGLLSDVRITADTNGNALVVTAPEKSMGLIAALIEELDTLPSASAQIKVFTIVNGDAAALSTMLQQLLSQQAQNTQGGTQFGQGTLNPFLQRGLQSAAAMGESSLVPIRFGVDSRTNSIIATGSEGDLGVVEAILLRLDEAFMEDRRTTVYWLANSSATAVADAVNLWLQEREQFYDDQLQLTPESPDILLNRDVIVVPEAISNSIIISATPEWFDEVSHVVQSLDRRMPLVKIDMLIVEIELNDFFEFGAEYGLQDSLLYDRTYTGALGGQPGYNFNNESLGDIDGDRGNVLGQALSTFGLLRSSSTLGYGGLVLSASRDSVSVLIRALQEDSRAQILSRPHISTLDGQPASVFVGTTTARPGQATQNATTTTTSVNETDVGLLLGVTPRVTPDGLVIMEVDARKSRLSEDSVTINDNEIRNINTIDTATTIAARSGQTVVFTGLIDTTEATEIRGIPYLSDMPLLGPLFSFTRNSEVRKELLIILTPHVIQCDEETDWFVYAESERMSWCASDIVELYGDLRITSRPGDWCQCDCNGTPVIFPDVNPLGVCAENGTYYERGPEPIRAIPAGPLLPPPVVDPTNVAPAAEPELMDQTRWRPVPGGPTAPATALPAPQPIPFTGRPVGYVVPETTDATPKRLPMTR